MAGLINTQVTPVRNYDVFLNHRGPDVKRGFVDHLSAALETAGVHSFVDYKELHRGENNWDAIESAIGHSKVHIAIFSGGYADSSWCLRELHAMLQCRTNRSSDLFLPVFYNVTPSDLRHSSSPSSCYFSAFEKLLSNCKPEDVQNWKNALYQASNITGHTLANEHGARGFEASLVKRIVSDVLNVLNLTLLDVTKHAVGVDEKLQEALHLIEIDKVQKGFLTLGIFGMGGMGKTTLAKSIYNSIYRKFDCCSFMECVSEAKTTNDLRGVEERMLRALLKDESISITDSACGKEKIKARLCKRKILIILDDVDDQKQLEKLCPIESYHPDQDGSLLVITTRDEQMVTTAQKRLHVEGLSDQNAHLLFNWHAFLRRDAPSKNFERLAKKVVDACDGLPLALVTMGSHLYNKDIAFWTGTVKALESDRRNLPPAQKKVTSILRTSYDGLGSEEKSMFLDIACFLNGEQKARAMRIWGESHAAELCLETLKLKSLVKLDQDGRLTMHDLLRDMGREIVEGSHKNIWQRSHLWNKGDVHLVLRNKKGTSEVRGVCLAMEGRQEELDTKSFAGMDLLQILVLRNGNIIGDFSYISKELRWFQWRNCPLDSFPCELALNNVAVLDLERSKISSLSPGHMLKNLQELNLKGCSNLKKLPEFNDCCNILEVLDLKWCWNLESVPESIGCLSSSLTHLDLSRCYKLTTLPDGLVNLHFLKSLLLNHCMNLTRLPDSIGQLTTLQEIGLEGLRSLMLLPQSFGNLIKLSSLDLDGCCSLKELPSTIGNLTNLVDHKASNSKISRLSENIGNLHKLLLNHCISLTRLPDSIGQLTTLEEIGLEGLRALKLLPQSFGNLTNLSSLNLDGCCSLKELPSTIGNLTNLVNLKVCNSKMSRLPEKIGNLHKLVTLNLGCNRRLSYLPSSIGQLEELVTLDLGNCNIGDGGLPKDYSSLSSLQVLRLYDNYFSRLPKHFYLLSKLQTLSLRSCYNLREISHLPTSLTVLYLNDCRGLREISHLPPSLTDLDVGDCPVLTRLSSLSSLQKLRKLDLNNCRGLGELVGLDCLSHLEELNIGGCKGLTNLSQSASLTSLRVLDLGGSGVSLLQDNEPWIQDLGSLERIILYGDKVPECFSSCKFKIQGVSGSDEFFNECCLKVRVSQGGLACKGVVFCIIFPSGGDGYIKTDVLGAVGDSPKFSQLLRRIGRLADPRNELHILIFRASHPFVASLKGGDTIRVVAWSYAAIKAGAVKLVYEENEMEEILQELSMETVSSEMDEERELMEESETEESDTERGEEIEIEESDEETELMEDPIKLELTNWSVDGGLPDAYSTLSSLEKMDLAFMPISQLPSNFHLLTNLISLELRSCSNLCEIPSLPPTLMNLDLGYCPNLRAILCLFSLKELRDLVLCSCIRLVELLGLDCLVHLSQLNITGCKRLESLPRGIEKLTSLKSLYMAGSGVSLLQDNEPWIQKLASLELISVYGDEVPECLIKGVIKKEHANECCMEAVVPEVDVAYKAALFCFVWHDQGWSNFNRDRSHYRNIHSTSLHVEINVEREAADQPKFSKSLRVNRHMDIRNQLHMSIFKASHVSLKGGDTIRALVKSSDPEWAITVKEGVGKVMSGENEMDEILRTLSRQSKLKCQDKWGPLYHFPGA